jgi:hypothetical protein
MGPSNELIHPCRNCSASSCDINCCETPKVPLVAELCCYPTGEGCIWRCGVIMPAMWIDHAGSVGAIMLVVWGQSCQPCVAVSVVG